MCAPQTLGGQLRLLVIIVVFLLGTLSGNNIDVVYTATEGKPVHLYFAHGYPVSLSNPSGITIVHCVNYNDCSSNDFYENCFYDDSLSNETVAAFIIARPTPALAGTWDFYVESKLLESVQLEVKESPCGPHQGNLPVFTCPITGNSTDSIFAVTKGQTIRLFCPVKYPMNLDGPDGLNTVVECSSNINCKYNYKGFVRDPYCSNTTDESDRCVGQTSVETSSQMIRTTTPLPTTLATTTTTSGLSSYQIQSYTHGTCIVIALVNINI